MEILDFGAPKPPITDEEVAVLVAHIQTTLNDPEYVVVPEEDGFNFAECVDTDLLPPVELTEEELQVLNEAREQFIQEDQKQLDGWSEALVLHSTQGKE